MVQDTRRDLSDAAREALAGLADYLTRHGHPPSFRELAEVIGRPFSSTQSLLTTLRKHGLVSWKDFQKRTLHVTAAGWQLLRETKQEAQA